MRHPRARYSIRSAAAGLFAAAALALFACLLFPAAARALFDGPRDPVSAAASGFDSLTATDDVYTFGWISDTQNYCKAFPDVYFAMTSFLFNSRERLNLQYVIHTGDLVNDVQSQYQWQIADAAMRELFDVPYGVLAGNHDVAIANGLADYTAFSRYFGKERFAGGYWYGESYENNRGHCDLVSAGDTDYIFAYMGYPVDSAGADFLNSAFSAHPDRVGVLCVHDYFDNNCNLTGQGTFLFETVVKKNPNLYLVLCGHRYACKTVPAEVENPDGSQRTVLQCIANYQAAGREGGSGYLRLIQVDEESQAIRIISYSPLLNDIAFYDDPENARDPAYFDPDGECEIMAIPWLP